jgi:hypothetical protein
MWLRTFSMMAGSVISAMTRNVPPHSGQTGNETDSWEIVWAIQGVPGYVQIVASQNDTGEIVMKYRSPEQNPPRRITFYPADEAGWTWKLEFSFGGGDTRNEVYRIKATRL